MASVSITLSGISSGEQLTVQAGDPRGFLLTFSNLLRAIQTGAIPCASATAGLSATDAVRASAEVTATTAGDLGTVINGTTVTTTFATSADVTATAAVAGINANTTVNKWVTATKSGTGKFVVTANLPGELGNAVTLTVTGTGASATGSGKLIGGTGGFLTPVSITL